MTRAAGRKASYANPVCPIPSLREHLVKMLNGYCVWHVPDHKVTGLLFKQPLELGIDGKSLFQKGELSRDKFNAKLDKVITHIDRHGKAHRKVLQKDAIACIRISEAAGLEVISIAQFLQLYAPDGALSLSKKERLIFKGDLLAFKNDKYVYQVGQLSARDGVLATHAVETKTFDELKTTGLKKSFNKASALLDAIVIRHPIELALHAKAHKQMP